MAVVLAAASSLVQPAVGVGLPLGQDEAASVVGAECFTSASEEFTPCSGNHPTDQGHTTANTYNRTTTGNQISYFTCTCGGSYMAVNQNSCSGS